MTPDSSPKSHVQSCRASSWRHSWRSSPRPPTNAMRTCPQTPPTPHGAPYEASRLYGTTAFAQEELGFRWLRHMCPRVLRLGPPSRSLEPLRRFRLPVPRAVRPRGLARKLMRAGYRSDCSPPPHSLRTYNPSLAVAPRNLVQACPRCRYVVSLRVDAMHQCDASGAYITGFKNAALAVMDADLEMLGWTWLYNEPHTQIDGQEGSALRTELGLGLADAAPPWSSPFYDVRLFDFDGTLFATGVCRCATFDVVQLHVNATVGAAGGLEAYTKSQGAKKRKSADEKAARRKQRATKKRK